MATPKKQPNGKWKVTIYSHTDENNKKHYKCFTGRTKKEAAERANAYLATSARSLSDVTVLDAIGAYIQNRSNVLSASSVRGYNGLYRNAYSDIKSLKIANIRSEDVQKWVNAYSVNHSPKTVRNAYGLLVASINALDPDKRIRARLPEKQPSALYCPTESDIRLLLQNVEDERMERAIYLGAFGGLRRGEICALSSDDIKGNVLHITKNKVKSDGGSWIIKAPKTQSSNRRVVLPDFVIDKIKVDGIIVDMNPEELSNRFLRLVKSLEVPHFRFHDLRHFAASYAHANGMPDQYIQERFGWSSDRTLKQIYRNTMADKTDEFTEALNQKLNTFQPTFQPSK